MQNRSSPVEARGCLVVETVFTPFRVSDGDIRAQQEALDAGQVQRDSRLLIMEQGAGRLALV